MKKVFFIVAIVAWVLASRADSVILAWDVLTKQNITGFNLYYGTTPGDYTNEIDVGMHNAQIVTGLAPGWTYYFTVAAYNGIGAGQQSANLGDPQRVFRLKF